MSKKQITKKRAGEEIKEPQAPVEQAIEILKLVFVPSPTTAVKGFDYNALLFVAHVRQFLITTKKGPTLQVGKSLTLQVFGEMQKFTVTQVKRNQEDIVNEYDEEDPTVDSVTQAKSQGTQVITDSTEIVFEESEIAQTKEDQASQKGDLSSFMDVKFAGFEEQLNTLEEIIQIKLVEQGIENIKGVLVHGPAGIGKSLAIATILEKVRERLTELETDGSADLLVERLTPADLVTAKDQGKMLMAAFETVMTAGRPAVLWVEEIDYIAKTKNLFYQFLAQLDRFQGDRIIVLATSSKLSDVDKSLRRGGRLDLDIRFDMPSSQDRFEIMKVHLANLQDLNISITDEELKNVANASSGFVSSDIAQIIRNAHLIAIKKNRNPDPTEEPECFVNLKKTHLEQAVIDAKPLSIQDLLVEVPKTLWSEIGGNVNIKFQVRQCVEWPLKYPHKFTAVGIKPPQGILLYGPPGCSKTMIAKALATESGLNFIAVKGPELFSKYVGDTEKAIREIFRKARLSSPSIIFFDEIDAMATQRGDDDTSVSDRALCQLLNEMDGVEARSQVIVVAATNRLDIIDSALLRPGRFDRLVYVPLPDQSTRQDIFRINVGKMQHEQSALDGLEILGQDSEGFSGAEIALVCREAGLKALTEDMRIETAEPGEIKVTFQHLQTALAEVKVRGGKKAQ